MERLIQAIDEVADAHSNRDSDIGVGFVFGLRRAAGIATALAVAERFEGSPEAIAEPVRWGIRHVNGSGVIAYFNEASARAALAHCLALGLPYGLVCLTWHEPDAEPPGQVPAADPTESLREAIAEALWDRQEARYATIGHIPRSWHSAEASSERSTWYGYADAVLALLTKQKQSGSATEVGRS